MKRKYEEDAEGAKKANAQEGPWIKRFSNTQKRDYWFNESTGVSVWEDPTATAPTSVLTISSKSNDATAVTSDNSEWTKLWSKTYSKHYWHNSVTGQTSWEEPILSKTTSQKSNIIFGEAAEAALEKEAQAVAVYEPRCPRLRSFINLPALVNRLRTERASKTINATTTGLEERVTSKPAKGGVKVTQPSDYKVIFTLADDDAAMVTRAVQEDEILKTRLKLRQGDMVVDLPSFWDVWKRSDGDLAREVLSSKDPHEAKWALQKRFSYKLATTFMPGYAKAIYEYFQAKIVLDPCAGWGDRMVGAASTQEPAIEKYVAFDPNRNLRPGYASLMKLFGHQVKDLGSDSIKFSNGFEIHSKPFEVGAANLPSDLFDLVFTSPPFFDYEMYNPNNPEYRDWIKEFYEPLMKEACRCVRPGCHVCIHIGDTSAGNIVPFLKERVHLITSLKLIYTMGLRGVMSDQLRPVWVFQKALPPPTSTSSTLPIASASTSSVSNIITSSQSQPKLASGIAGVLSSDMIARIKRLTNPPILTSQVREGSKTYTVYDDGQCIGGSKQRLLGRLIGLMPEKELIYAGPDGGIAQVALAYTARLWGKKATIFLNTFIGAAALKKPPLMELAEVLGATIQLTDSSTGRTLKQTQEDATAYVAQNPADRALLPFGLKATKGERLFELFREALLEALPVDKPPPKRLWLVGGSAFIFDVLSSIWEETEFMLVQVGKKIWPDQLEGKKVTLFVAPEKFGAVAVHQPPFKTVPWYDAKVWQFVLQHGRDGDSIWNVGRVPDNPLEAAALVSSHFTLDSLISQGR